MRIMDFDKYLEKMICNTNVIWIRLVSRGSYLKLFEGSQLESPLVNGWALLPVNLVQIFEKISRHRGAKMLKPNKNLRNTRKRSHDCSVSRRKWKFDCPIEINLLEFLWFELEIVESSWSSWNGLCVRFLDFRFCVSIACLFHVEIERCANEMEFENRICVKFGFESNGCVLKELNLFWLEFRC